MFPHDWATPGGCAFDRQPVPAKGDERAGKRPAQRRTGLTEAVIKRFELAQFDRALVTDMRDDTAEKP
jgi:hypothetical protein